MSFAPSIWKIGITGGIGSGKSNVLSVLRSLNVPVIDADQLGHQAYDPGTPTYSKIVSVFGREILTAASPSSQEDDSVVWGVAPRPINRQILGSKVFGPQNAENMKKLTDIVWPRIGELAREKILDFEKKFERKEILLPVVAMEGAVLIEAEWYHLFDSIWVTYVPPSVAVQRIVKRNNLSIEEAQRRLASQISNPDRLKHATFSINTDRDMEDTNRIIKEEFDSLLSRISNEGMQKMRSANTSKI